MDVFDFGGGFVVVVVEMEVDDLELEVGAVVRVVWSFANGELNFLWRLRVECLWKEKCLMLVGIPLV